MIESRARRLWRIVWGVVLALVSPGLALIYARRAWSGLVLLVLDQAGSSGMVAITQLYAPMTEPLGYLGALTGALLLLRLVVAVIVARILRTPRAQARWFATAWFATAVALPFAIGIDAVSPSVGWRAFSVPSGSMIPTLHVGDYFIADVRAPGARPQPGAVVVFAAPGPDDVIFVKRAVGLPGDMVQVRTGHLTINGRPTGQRSEPSVDTEDGEARRYVETLPAGASFRIQKLRDDGPMNDTPEYVVPPGNLFVMGDNRDNSLDSRSLALRDPSMFGFVPFPNVLGTASLIYWPPSRAFKPIE